jgi:hypothetical protein
LIEGFLVADLMTDAGGLPWNAIDSGRGDAG